MGEKNKSTGKYKREIKSKNIKPALRVAPFISLHRHTSEILRVWLQTTAIKQIPQQSESCDFFRTLVHYLSLLSVQQHQV